MAISPTSRYATSVVSPVTDTAGVTRATILPKSPTDTAYTVTYYAWKAGDRMDKLASHFYQDERQWWLIVNANPEIVPNASGLFNLAPGTVIRIPANASA